MKEFIEKLIGRLEEKVVNRTFDESIKTKNLAYKEAIEIVNQLAEEYKTECNSIRLYNGWIPCSELPEENGMYLCTVFHADDYVVWIMRFNDGEFLKPDDVEDWNYELLAWMPIAPYQPKGE